MAEEEYTLDLNTDDAEQLRNKNRFESLSNKVELTAKERDEAVAKTTEEAAARSLAEKERDFYKDFSSTSSKFPNAHEYQDAIKEKVMSGYSVEDATVAVLNKEGKLGGQVPVPAPTFAPIAGGSATNAFQDGGQKSPQEMTQVERRAALVEAQNRGDLSIS